MLSPEAAWSALASRVAIPDPRPDEDVVAGELVAPQGKRLGPFDIGALLAAGVTRAHVRRKPRVALIASGDELVEPDVEPRPGDVVEFNSRVLAALVAEWGGQAVR